MSDFDVAMDVVIMHEGGWEDRPGDRGGKTNYGVTLPFLREFRPEATLDDLKNLTRIGAEEVYKKLLWDRWALDMINDQSVATKLLDSAVWQGWPWAWITAQRCCSRLGRPLKCDGVLGPNTRWAINTVKPELFLQEFCTEQLNLIDEECERDPRQKPFVDGWAMRAKWKGDYA